MAKIYGKVVSGPEPTSTPVEATLKECIDYGFDDPHCLMVAWADGGCLFYNYQPITTPMIIVETEEDSGSYVAIKTFAADTCPATFNDIDLTFTSLNGDTYPWTKTANGVSFSGCRSGWTRFDRANGRSVCLKAFELSLYVTKAIAISTCQQADAEIVGVETKAEIIWMSDEKNKIKGKSSAFWIDGERVPDCLPPIDDIEKSGCNDFIWSNNLTSSIANLSDINLATMSYYDFVTRKAENCLVVWIYNKLNDASCTYYDAASGVFCGYKLL